MNGTVGSVGYQFDHFEILFAGTFARQGTFDQWKVRVRCNRQVVRIRERFTFALGQADVGLAIGRVMLISIRGLVDLEHSIKDSRSNT